MQYLTRLLLTPSLTTLAIHCARVGLRLELPRADPYFWMALLYGVPALVVFLSQLHRLDVLRRIERLESKVEQLERGDVAQSPAASLGDRN